MKPHFPSTGGHGGLELQKELQRALDRRQRRQRSQSVSSTSRERHKVPSINDVINFFRHFDPPPTLLPSIFKTLCFTRERLRYFCMWAKKFFSEWLKYENSVKDKICWFYYLEMFWKLQVLKKTLKRAKKTGIFFLFRRFYTGRKNVCNKKCIMLNFLNLK